ncbi:MAG: Xaa-Pro peptidase family protein [Actinomycetota bacterium]|nr:Xaa-Pro peptidase family protein [Actinomycetota bacterium]
MADGVAKFGTVGFDRGRFSRLLAERGLEAALLTSPESVQYTTGYPALPSAGNPILHTLQNQFPSASLIGADGRSTLACWLVSMLGVEFDVDEVSPYLDHAGALDVWGKLLAAPAASGGRIGVEATFPLFALRLLEKAGGSSDQLVPIDDDLIALRVVKSPAEVALLERSIGIVEETVSELYDVLEVGMSRLDLIAEAKTRMLSHGATGISHVTVSFGKANPELGIAETLEPGKLVTLDLGATVEGYCSDNRRYAWFGDVPEALVSTQSMMVDVVDAVGEALVPGATEASVFERGAELFREHGLDPYFFHVGHHIGLQTEERWLTGSSEAVVEPGMVVNIELYTPVEGIDFVGDEETFVVEEGGPRRISRLPRDIRAL